MNWLKNFDIKSSLKNIDMPFWYIYMLLSAFAAVALFSAGSTLTYEEDSIFGPILDQVGFMLIGLLAVIVLNFTPSKVVRQVAWWGLIVVDILLIFMLIPGNPIVVEINGAGRWCKLPLIPQFQPSEFAKMFLVIVVADNLSQVKSKEEFKQCFWKTLLIAVITCAPILKGNLSTTFLMASVVYILWFLARMPWKYLLWTAVVVMVLGVTFFCIADFCYIKKGKEVPFLGRTSTWVSRLGMKPLDAKTLDLDEALNDENYQRTLAKVAVARGGKTPLGVGVGNSLERDYLPLAYADYIFSIIVEESGIIGAVALMIIYFVILIRACIVSKKYEDYAAMLMVMGLALMLTIQTLMSMAVSVGIIVTGQPLPLISKGGTSVCITACYFGIIMGVAREQNACHNREKQVIEDSYSQIPDITLNDK